MSIDKDIFWHSSKLTQQDRQLFNGHKSGIIWLTGLSGSGKSTLSFALERILFNKAVQCFVLDGDNIRHGLSHDLGFEKEDRKENIRRVGEVCKLFASAGFIVIASFISPFNEDRQWVRHINSAFDFFEIYVKCPLTICEKRDPKGIYLKARQGLVTNFTGIDSKYEEPLTPELIVNTDSDSIEKCTDQILNLLNAHHLFTSNT